MMRFCAIDFFHLFDQSCGLQTEFRAFFMLSKYSWTTFPLIYIFTSPTLLCFRVSNFKVTANSRWNWLPLNVLPHYKHSLLEFKKIHSQPTYIEIIIFDFTDFMRDHFCLRTFYDLGKCVMTCNHYWITVLTIS